MKENEHIVTQSKTNCKWHTCPKCGSNNLVEHFASYDENKPFDPADAYHWYCLDCGHKDYDYLPF